METTPAAPCEETRSSDLQSTAPSDTVKVPIEEHNSGEPGNTNQPMDTDPVPVPVPVEPEKRKREEEEEAQPLNSENKKQNLSSNSSSSPLWKTSLCSYYRRPHPSDGAGCSHGATCRYAHGEAELRPRPDKTWDPTSNKAKEMEKAKANEKQKEEEIEDEEQYLALDESSLDKCLVGLPRKWANDALNKFLHEKVCQKSSFFFLFLLFFFLQVKRSTFI